MLRRRTVVRDLYTQTTSLKVKRGPGARRATSRRHGEGAAVRAVARGPQSRTGLLVGHASRAPAKTIQGVRLRQPRAASSGRAPDRDRPARLEPHGGVEIRVRGRRRHVRIFGRDLALAPLRG